MPELLFFGAIVAVAVLGTWSACKDSGITFKGFIAGLKGLWG